MGNSVAFIVLLSWPAVAGVLFSRLSVERAIIWTLLGGYLLLPPQVSLDLPMIPSLNKDSVAALSALVGALVTNRGAAAGPRLEPWTLVLVALMVAAPAVTAVSNPEPLAEGITYRPGLSYYDGFTGAIGGLLTLVPFLLGYRFLSGTHSIELFLQSLVVAALAYSVPMLLEIRLSPQLNVWVYGFFAHDFSQTIRYGGYRPMVFLNHGLWVAMFAAMAVMAAATLLRLGRGAPGNGRRRLVLVWLALVLVLCKSLAAVLYAALLVPVILLVPPRRTVMLAGLLAALVFAYPMARSMGLVPVDALVELAAGFDEERARSLAFRFDNEQMLLDRALEKPLSGWGGWGRNQIVDPVTGRYASIADGQWIVQMGMHGIMGYLAMFGLLCGAVLRVARLAWRGGAVEVAVGALALIMAASLIDLIPNATLTTLTWLCAGALAGRAARSREAADDPAPALRSGRLPPLRTVM